MEKEKLILEEVVTKICVICVNPYNSIQEAEEKIESILKQYARQCCDYTLNECGVIATDSIYPEEIRE